MGAGRVGVDEAGIALGEPCALLLGPAPGVVGAVAGGAVDEQVVLRGGDGEVAGGLVRVVDGSQGAVREELEPDVAERGVGGYEAVVVALREHVVVAQGEDEVAALRGGAEELG